MAAFSLFFFLLSLILTTTAATTTTTTTTLDVTSSVQKTIDILNPTFLHTQSDQQQTTSLSFTVHPRSSIRHTHHDTYDSLTHDRLTRDTHRVNSLITNLNFALAGTNLSDMKPLAGPTNSNYTVQDLSTPVTSGISQGSGEYFAKVGLGTPAKPYYMVIDTGSDITWLQCQPCSDCYQQTDPIYDPAGSSSYSALPCGSPQCESLEVTACRSSGCLYQVSYGDGSFTEPES